MKTLSISPRPKQNFDFYNNYLVLRVTDDTAKHLTKNVVASDRQRSVANRLKALAKFEALWLSEGRNAPKVVKLLPLEG